MGRGGVDPRYFLNDMRWWEIRLYMDGLNQRTHAGWEQARFIAHTVACMFCKDVAPQPEDWARFSWEKKTGKPKVQYDEDYVREMRDMMKRENEMNAKSKARKGR